MAQGSIDIKQEIRVDASKDVVWDILTSHTGEWWQAPYRLFDDAEISLDLSAGGLLAERTRDGKVGVWGTITLIEPQATLQLTGACGMAEPVHGAFSFELTGEGEETTLTLHHQAFGSIADDQQDIYGDGWEFLLGNLKSLVERA